MKEKISLQLALLLLLGGVFCNCSRDKTEELSQTEKIVINSSPELYDLTSEWVACYLTLNPELEMEVFQTSESKMREKLSSTSQLNFVTSDFIPEIKDWSLWKLTIGRDIIVPVINFRNPYAQEIMKQGISPAGLARILNNPQNTHWNAIIEGVPDMQVQMYLTDNPDLYAGIAAFLEKDELSFSEELIRDPDAFLASLQNEEHAIGFCYLTDVVSPRNMSLYEDIRIMPIDKNGNGQIDYKEEIYASLDDFARGVWIGKYPKKLASSIYTVASVAPMNENEQAFLSWVISKGHVLLDNHGFGELSEFERLAQAKIIDGIGDGQPGGEVFTLPKEPGFFARPLTYVLAFLVLLTLRLYFVLRNKDRISETVPKLDSIHEGLIIDENQVELAPGLYYDKSHTWAYMEKDGTVKVGIDDFLQRITGPLTRVKMKFPGERVKKGKKAVSIIQDGKQLDIYAPLSGTIKEQNSQLTTDASLLNSSPYSEGWIYKIEPANWVKEVQFLIMGNHYRLWLKKEFQRLKDFLADTLKTENAGYEPLLQDGGEVNENILMVLGPEAWEDFQTNFLDVPS